MEWINPYIDEIAFVVKVFAGLTLFWILWISVQWIRFRKREPFKVPSEIVIPNIDTVTIMKRPAEKEYIIKVKLKEEKNVS